MARRRSFRRTFTHQGAPPGHMVAPETFVEPMISVMAYGPDRLEEEVVGSVEAALAASGPGIGVRWIDVRGLGDGGLVRGFGEALGLHPLALSDVVHLGQRPKVDEYEDSTYVVLRMATMVPGGEALWEQVSLFVRDGLVLTFQETHHDCLGSLRERIRAGRPTIRGSGADYLAVMVMDAIIDGYFPIVDALGEELDRLEDRILSATEESRGVLTALYGTKRSLTAFRRAAWPLREAMAQALRAEGGLGLGSAHLHLRDALDHVTQLSDVNESYSELASSLIDVHLSLVGQRTNDVMQVLTVVSTIFIPLTFIAGIYGMNFDTSHPLNLPELGSPYGYPVFWAVSLALAGVLLVLFRRLGWLGGR